MLEPVDGLPPHDFGQADAFGIVGESPAAWQLRQQVAFVGRRDLHTLVLGESGTGKELAARALHALSGRASGPFVARNAATLPEGLVDAEMFGHVASYPHAGMPARPGLVGAAHTGTLLLDELAELPKELQAHLLRLLDDGEYHRLGDTRTSRADVRVIGATNRPLEAFREDVRARFPLHVRVPALSARRADVPLLLRHLLRQAAGEDLDLRARFFDDAGEPRLTVAYVAAMLQDLPAGNVRGLRAALWRDMEPSGAEPSTRRGGPPPPRPSPRGIWASTLPTCLPSTSRRAWMPTTASRRRCGGRSGSTTASCCAV